MAKSGYSVYMHTCPNCKVYIGITSQEPKRRWRGGVGYASQKYFYRAIIKYGWENIKHEILYEGLTKEQAEQKEIELIALYKSNQREYGYNLANGGKVNNITDEGKARISQANKGRKLTKEAVEKLMTARKNTVMSEEWRAKISEANKGRKFTEEHKQKLSLAKKGKTHKPCSEETKEKIAMAQKSRREVEQYTLTGELLNKYVSIKEAAKAIGACHQGISSCCTGRRKTAFGFVWKYAEVG